MLKTINEKRKKILRERILLDLKTIKPKRVLDNGSGAEGSWNHDKTPNIKITSIDKIKGDDSQNLKFKNSSFDCIVFAGVIQYLEKPEKSLEECFRVLKKGGKLIFATINSDSLIKAISGFKTENFILTPKGAKIILQEKGFKKNENPGNL
jgi:SAM-dependent methyltransferase